MKKRFMSCLLVVAMVITMCRTTGLPVYAETAEDGQKQAVETNIAEPEEAVPEEAADSDEINEAPDAAELPVSSDEYSGTEESSGPGELPITEELPIPEDPSVPEEPPVSETPSVTEEPSVPADPSDKTDPQDPAAEAPEAEPAAAEEETVKVDAANTGTVPITKVNLATTFDIPDLITVGADVPFTDYNDVIVTGVEADGEALDTDMVQFDMGESGWFFFDNFVEECYEWVPYQEGTTAGMNFYEGENQFRAWIYVPEDVDASFADNCEYYINGKKMEVLDYLNDHGDVYLRLSVYSKPMITRIYLTAEEQEAWAGKAVVNPEVHVERIEGNAEIPNDAITVSANWSWQNNTDYIDYGSGETFKKGNNYLKVYAYTAGSEYGFATSSDSGNDYLQVYLNDRRMTGYVYAGDYYAVTVMYRYIDDPELSIYQTSLGQGSGKISLDGTTWITSQNFHFPLGTTVTLRAKPDEGSEFVEWRTGQEPVFYSTTQTISFTVTAPERYTAVFQKAIPAAATLCDTVDYTFDSATGTLTLIPTGDDGEGGRTGYASVPSYDTSPFYQTTAIRHIVVQEGITGIGNYVFEDVKGIQSVSLPASLRLMSGSAFDGSSLYGTGFTVAAGNETYKTIDGSLVTLNGEHMVRFFQKPGQTEYAIPEGVTEIGWLCFENNNLNTLTLRGDLSLSNYAIRDCIIKHIVIEEGVRNLGMFSDFDCQDMQMSFPASLQNAGSQNMFLDSVGIQAFSVPEESAYYSAIDGVLYRKNEEGTLELIKYPYGRSETEFTVPEGVTAVYGRVAVNNPNLKTITLPDDMAYLDDDVFWYLDGVTVVVNNPDCVFDPDAFWQCKNITLKGYTGSTAQRYASDHGFDFVSLGEAVGHLDNPVNLRWEGNIAKWDTVPNAARYDIKFYRKEPGMTNYIYMNTEDQQLTGDVTEFDYSTLLWYQDSDYKFTVTASATGYEPSETVESPVRHGRFTIRDIPLTLDGDSVIVNFTDDEGVSPAHYEVELYDTSGTYISRIYGVSASENRINLRSALTGSGFSYDQYRIRLAAYASYAQVGGWQIKVGETAEPVLYDFQPVSDISRIEVTIPEPVAGTAPQLQWEQLNVKTYCGSDLLDGLYVEDGYYGHRWMYLENSVWQYSYDSVRTGKDRYGYELTLHTQTGYRLAGDAELYINGTKVTADNTETITFTNTDWRFRYMFPEGLAIKTTLAIAEIEDIPDQYYTGKAIKPVLTVTLDGDPLVKTTDYTVSYSNNIDVGTATAKITGTGDYVGEQTKTFIIKEPVAVTKITLPKEAEVATKNFIQLMPTFTPADATDQTVTWKSSDETVAKVDKNGKVRALKYGTATVTATASNGKKASCKIQTRFNDVNNPGKSYYKAVYWAVDNNITKCTVTFRPEDTVTRGEFVAFMYRASGSPKVSHITDKFSDVDESTKFAKEITWAVDAGIIKGFSDGTFGLTTGLTREMCAIMIWRWAGRPEPSTTASPFSDVKPSGADSYKAILWGAENGIIKGNKGRFLPKDPCTRANVVTFLYRYLVP